MESFQHYLTANELERQQSTIDVYALQREMNIRMCSLADYE